MDVYILLLSTAITVYQNAADKLTQAKTGLLDAEMLLYHLVHLIDIPLLGISVFFQLKPMP